MTSKKDDFLREVLNGEDSFSKSDRSFDCTRCGSHFVPEEGQWIFYNLCNECFVRFDNQKMTRRFMAMGFEPKDDKKRYESAAEWIQADVQTVGKS